VEALCQAALERPAAERDAFLRRACSDDDLRREVEMLLARDSAADRFLETGVGAAAVRVLSGENAVVPGRKVGAFEIGRLLGAGAMGEVFRARDVNLDREVAIKILPAAFAVDPDRLARFKREAQVLAALNHPNIASIYGFEGSSGMQALVLELVEGPTLADRIVHGPVPIDEALPIARQIAEGLEAAHEQGIIHRDLKPANIKLRPDGTVKVLDFGLAKVLEQEATAGDATASPTITTRSMVQRGVILGTAAYMSPEQARGHPADKRSDVWAFGAVLYEMLAGQLPFKGNDITETLAAVIGRDIDWAALPVATPPSVRRLIARCFERDLNHRLRDIGQARLVLEDAASSMVATRSDLPAGRVPLLLPARRPSAGWRRAMALALFATVTAAAAAAAWYLKPSPPLQVARLSFNLPDGQSLSSGDRSMLALSPDGTQIAYVAAASGLYLRSLSSGESKPIRGAEDNLITEPVFSPDGQSIVFCALSDRMVKRVPIAGGAPVTICEAAFGYGLSWGSDGILFVERDKGIMRVDPEGGTPTVLVALNDGEAVQRPQTLPGGQHLLFTLATGSGSDRWDRARVVVQSLTSGKRKTLFEGGTDARYLPTGHIVYAVGGSLFAVAFDAQRLEVAGPAVPMIEGVRRSGLSLSLGGAQYSVSSNGSLVYVPGAVSAQWDLGLTDRRGEVTPFNLLPGSYEVPRVSPDGKRVAFGSDDGKEAVVWIYDLSGGSPMRRLTFGGNNRFPAWSSDGKRVVFQSDRDGDRGLFWQPADGGEAARLTKPNAGEAHEPESWSPNGDRLLFSVTKGSDVSLWILSLADQQSTPFGDVHSTIRTGAVFSPDGRWVAYATTGASRTTIYVQPFPPTGDKRQLPPRGGEPKHPVWSADGGQLFYNPGPGLFESVSVTTLPTFAFGNPVALPRPFPGAPPSARRPYDITPDGKFVSPIAAGQSRSGRPSAPQIQVVLNWFEDLRTRVPLPK
jgi:serine/threonine-protein kinase